MRVQWEPDKETFQEFKQRKSSIGGLTGMGQKNKPLEKLSDLRLQALKRAKNKCEWANCNQTKWLEMAHLVARSLDSTKRADINNVTMLCKRHHDIFDGRTISGSKREYIELLSAYLKLQWSRR